MDFTPGPCTVICGRGKQCLSNPGNKNLKRLVQEYLSQYSMTQNKAEKSIIVTKIIDDIRTNHSDDENDDSSGIFVKFLQDKQEFWEVDDAFAREKIGCMFRDMLHTQYKSSTKAKHARKKVLRKQRKQQELQKMMVEATSPEMTPTWSTTKNIKANGLFQHMNQMMQQYQQERKNTVSPLNTPPFLPPMQGQEQLSELPRSAPSSTTTSRSIVQEACDLIQPGDLTSTSDDIDDFLLFGNELLDLPTGCDELSKIFDC